MQTNYSFSLPSAEQRPILPEDSKASYFRFFSALPSALVNNIKAASQEALSQTADFFVSESLYLGSQYPTTGKLISGTICTATGVYCIVKSNVPSRVFSFFSRSPEPSSTQPAQASSKQNWAVFTLGMLSATYGAYNLISALNDLLEIYSDESSTHMAFNPGLHASDSGPRHLTCSPNEKMMSGADALALISSCPASNQILEEIGQQGQERIKIRELREEHFPYANFYGKWVPEARTIFIRKEFCKHKTSVLLFELLNAHRQEDLLSIFEQSDHGKLNRETYARLIEKLEFENRITHHRIVNACMESNGWDPELDVFAEMLRDFKSFNAFWKAVKNSPHVDLFREQWDKTARPAYCQRYPSNKACRPDYNPRYQPGSSYYWTAEDVEKDEL